MGIKSIIAKPLAKYIAGKVKKDAANALNTQEQIFKNLINTAAQTKFGKDHNFANITSYEEFKNAVPVRDYEGLKPYFDSMVAGEKNVLWPGQPLYFAKTSGTTSGVKYIPITKESIPYHINSARNA